MALPYHLLLDPEVKLPPGAVAPALRELLTQGATEDDLAEAHPNTLPELFYTLQQLRTGNWILYQLRVEGEVLATVRPIQPGFDFSRRTAGTRDASGLSRFAFLRRDGQRILLESPLSPVRIALEDRGVALLARLKDRSAQPQALARLLRQSGMMETRDDRKYAMWEFHDLLFHVASRIGRETVGATYRFHGSTTPIRAVKQPMSARRIVLPAVDLEAISLKDPPLTRVMENRRSRRGPGSRTLTLGQLSQFLFRTAHYRRVYRGKWQELVRRPMPAGGAIHELEFYVSVNVCDGLRRGLYHYHSREHVLYRLPAPPGSVEKLLSAAASASGAHSAPDVLITLASRFERIAWQYGGMAYRTTLLNSGVAVQTMYLVATAMNLSACAIGNGDPAVFAEATGLSPCAETSVAEFVLSGSARDHDTLAAVRSLRKGSRVLLPAIIDQSD